jgi:hypothetical protein
MHQLGLANRYHGEYIPLVRISDIDIDFRALGSAVFKIFTVFAVSGITFELLDSFLPTTIASLAASVAFMNAAGMFKT